jgi:hypothetical protein
MGAAPQRNTHVSHKPAMSYAINRAGNRYTGMNDKQNATTKTREYENALRNKAQNPPSTHGLMKRPSYGRKTITTSQKRHNSTGVQPNSKNVAAKVV